MIFDKCTGKGKNPTPMNDECIGCSLEKIDSSTLDDWKYGLMVHNYILGMSEKSKCKRDKCGIIIEKE